MNHFDSITKIISKKAVFSSSCDVKNVATHDGITHEALPLQLNLNTAYFVSGEEGKETHAHVHHHAHWMCVMSGQVELTVGDETKEMSAGDWVYIPGKLSHQMRYVTAGKVLCMHHECS